MGALQSHLSGRRTLVGTYSFLRRLTGGKTWNSKEHTVQGGYGALRYWRNWIHLTIDINPNGLTLALGPFWIDWWWAGGIKTWS